MKLYHKIGAVANIPATGQQVRAIPAPMLLLRVLGHRLRADPLRYARLYEATVVRDYRRAMAVVEGS